ncbi:MAG: hypothetical protein J6S14_11645 [Clostridia bacterium]|nr:hypothetical protein [Clostridia bacterium]
MNDRLYAVRDKDTGKLVSNITNPRRKYWDRKGNAESAIRKAKGGYYADPRNLKLVTFELVEVDDDQREADLYKAVTNND